MSRIYVYSPSGLVRTPADLQRAVRRLRDLGHSVQVDEAAQAHHQRFAGDDATRLAAIARAAASGADLALPTRGGYGLTRLLGQLPWDALMQAVRAGTHFVGLSDFTALQMGLLAKTGALSWAGPLLLADFGGTAPPDSGMLGSFHDLLDGSNRGVRWRMRADAPWSAAGDWRVDAAQLWGGNLSVLTSLLGTPWFAQVSGGILFLEDVGEAPYRIERMLTQLLHAGVLGKQRALLLGQFTRSMQDTGETREDGFALKDVFAWLRGQLDCPLLPDLPHGHVPKKVLLPVGAPVSLLVQGHEVCLSWGGEFCKLKPR